MVVMYKYRVETTLQHRKELGKITRTDHGIYAVEKNDNYLFITPIRRLKIGSRFHPILEFKNSHNSLFVVQTLSGGWLPKVGLLMT